MYNLYNKPSLLDRLGQYLQKRTFAKAIRHGQAVGDYVVVPEGFTGYVLHKYPGELSDPLSKSETVGWKLVKAQ